MQKRIEQEPALWETGPAVMEPPKPPRQRKNKPPVIPVRPEPEIEKSKPAPAPPPPPVIPQVVPPPTLLTLPEKIETDEQLRAVLDQDPPAEWLKIHPDAHGPQQADGSYLPYYYMPINRQKQLMHVIFGGYRREILQTAALKNSIVVTMRVVFRNPVTGLEEWQDGIGASSAAASLVQMAAPGAGSMAFMDAVKNIGRIFGRDLNKEGGEPVEANFTLNA
jgi:hypothetical protein